MGNTSAQRLHLATCTREVWASGSLGQVHRTFAFYYGSFWKVRGVQRVRESELGSGVVISRTLLKPLMGEDTLKNQMPTSVSCEVTSNVWITMPEVCQIWNELLSR